MKGWNNVLKRVSGTAVVVLVGIISAMPVAAQNTAWRIDSEHSTARLVLASSKRPDAIVNVGIARLGGVVDDSRDHPGESAFDFTMYPADETTVPTTSDDPSDLPDADAYTVISFKSKQVVPIGRGAFRVTGDLTLTYIERSTTYDATVAYSGPAYGPPVMHSEKRDAVFTFHWISAATLQTLNGRSAELSGSSAIAAEDFPELFSAVSATNWPAFVADGRCVMPLNVGEDFSGPLCSGEVVEPTPRTDIRCRMRATEGQDFAGEVCTGTPLQVATSEDAEPRAEERQHGPGAPNSLVANELKIQVDLQLRRIDSSLSVAGGE
jgi:polyisoprenoid-binding protein YceI